MRRSNRIKVTSQPRLFAELKAAGEAIGETLDCSVVAVAAACAVPYAEAHKVLSKVGRRERHGLDTSSILHAVRLIGKKTRNVTNSEMIEQYPSPHCDVLRSITSHHPRRFNRVWANGKRYLMFTRGHVLAVVDGVVIDWSINRVLRAIRVVEVTQ